MIEKRTNFDIGSHLRKSTLGLSEEPYFEFKYGVPDGGLGYAYYFNLAEGEPNVGTFESWGKDEYWGNSGNMKSGYNVLFQRNNRNPSIRVVFPTFEAKNKVYEVYRKILFNRKK